MFTKTKNSKTVVSERAMQIAEAFELQEGRISKRVDKDGVGYDLHSIDAKGERFIEVKGFKESWATHDWQSLYKSQVKVLEEHPEKFFLYIIHFDKEDFSGILEFFVISGEQLRDDGFKWEPESFRLSPISQRKLRPYAVSVARLDRGDMKKDSQHH